MLRKSQTILLFLVLFLLTESKQNEEPPKKPQTWKPVTSKPEPGEISEAVGSQLLGSANLTTRSRTSQKKKTPITISSQFAGNNGRIHKVYYVIPGAGTSLHRKKTHQVKVRLRTKRYSNVERTRHPRRHEQVASTHRRWRLKRREKELESPRENSVVRQRKKRGLSQAREGISGVGTVNEITLSGQRWWGERQEEKRNPKGVTEVRKKREIPINNDEERHRYRVQRLKRELAGLTEADDGSQETDTLEEEERWSHQKDFVETPSEWRKRSKSKHASKSHNTYSVVGAENNRQPKENVAPLGLVDAKANRPRRDSKTETEDFARWQGWRQTRGKKYTFVSRGSKPETIKDIVETLKSDLGYSSVSVAEDASQKHPSGADPEEGAHQQDWSPNPEENVSKGSIEQSEKDTAKPVASEERDPAGDQPSPPVHEPVPDLEDSARWQDQTPDTETAGRANNLSPEPSKDPVESLKNILSEGSVVGDETSRPRRESGAEPEDGVDRWQEWRLKREGPLDADVRWLEKMRNRTPRDHQFVTKSQLKPPSAAVADHHRSTIAEEPPIKVYAMPEEDSMSKVLRAGKSRELGAVSYARTPPKRIIYYATLPEIIRRPAAPEWLARHSGAFSQRGIGTSLFPPFMSGPGQRGDMARIQSAIMDVRPPRGDNLSPGSGSGSGSPQFTLVDIGRYPSIGLNDITSSNSVGSASSSPSNPNNGQLGEGGPGGPTPGATPVSPDDPLSINSILPHLNNNFLSSLVTPLQMNGGTSFNGYQPAPYYPGPFPTRHHRFPPPTHGYQPYITPPTLNMNNYKVEQPSMSGGVDGSVVNQPNSRLSSLLSGSKYPYYYEYTSNRVDPLKNHLLFSPSWSMHAEPTPLYERLPPATHSTHSVVIDSQSININATNVSTGNSTRITPPIITNVTQHYESHE